MSTTTARYPASSSRPLPAWPAPRELAARLLRACARLLALLAALRPPAGAAGARELRGMSDHELRDLGIGRCEIEQLLAAGRGRSMD